MKARIVKDGKKETYKIASFELINRNRHKYLTIIYDKPLSVVRGIEMIDLKDVQEIYITEDVK